MQMKIFFTIYLIAVTVVASTCIYFSSYTKESLAFAYCEFTDNHNGILYGVVNNGNTKVVIVDLVINQTSITEFWGYPYYAEIEAGKLEKLGVGYNWSWGYDYTITLVTARGARFSITEKAVPASDLLTVDNVSWDIAANTTSIILRNTGVRPREIVKLHLGTSMNKRDVTSSSNIALGRVLAINQTVEIILEWPNSWASSWISNETYFFSIWPEMGLSKQFNSTAPL